MLLTSREHTEMMSFFERQHPHLRLDKEPKNLWPKGNIYQNGEANQAFLAFREGVAYGKAIAQDG